MDLQELLVPWLRCSEPMQSEPMRRFDEREDAASRCCESTSEPMQGVDAASRQVMRSKSNPDTEVSGLKNYVPGPVF